jgi:predicted DNA-binding protein (MmcQ/YjbR family)
MQQAVSEKDLTRARRLCAALPDAEEYVMVHHPAFRVSKKPFLILGMNQGPTVSINLGVEAQGDLLADPRFMRTPYIGQHGWVTVALRDLRAAELAELVEQSFRRIAGKRRVAALDARLGRVSDPSTAARSPTLRRR